MEDILKKITESTDYIIKKSANRPEIGLVLGSGLGEMADEIENKIIIPYKDIPHFPKSTVSGHKGNLVIGDLMGKKVIALQGRFHFYEGYSMKEVTFPIRVMAKLNIETLILTNAAGGVNKSFQPGDLMLINDIINLQGSNPLIGNNLEEYGVRFPDMSTVFDTKLQNTLLESGRKINLSIKQGVYAAMSGPSYETPAEIRMLSKLGVDAVGMSTVPEAIVAKHSGIKVLGVSCISNMAAGILDQPLNHEEVIETTEKVKSHFKELIKITIKNL